MALGKRLINTGAAAAVCNTDSVQAFGADSAFSSNIALYQLDGNANDTTTNYDGVASSGVTYSTGLFGNAAVFNGSNSRITLPSASPFDNSNTVKSISAWIKPDTLTSRVFSYAASDSSNSQSYFQVGWFNDLSFIRINVTQGSSSVYSRYEATITPTTNWVHLLVQVTASGKEIYVNGVELSGTYNNSGGGANTDWIGDVSSIDNHTIGISRLNTPSYSDGSIDQIRIFDRQITPEEVSTLYNETTSTASNTNPLSDGSGVALYSLDYDASDAGGLYDGTPTNVDFGVGGQINYGARFNGSSSKVTTSLDFDTLTNYTISMWIKIDASPSARDFFAGTLDSSAKNGIYLANNTDETIRFYERNASGDTMTITSTDTINIGSWNHIVAVRDGNTDYLYINNGTPVSASNSTISHATGFTFGIAGAYTTYFDGSIDQVRIFSKALDSNEVSTLNAEEACVYTATTTDDDYPTTNLAYYKLDNSAEDETINANDGTWNGTEQYAFGRYGQAAKFTNDSTSWIDLSTTSTSIFSCSVWVKFDELGTTAQHVIGNSIEPSHPNDKNFNLYYRGDNNLNQFSFQSSEGYVGFGSTIQANQWYHVCWSGSNGTLTKVWIDGQEQTLPTVTETFDANGEWRVGVWRYRNSSNTLLSAHPLRGLVDQVRIYDAALTDSQVTELYNEKPEVDTSNFKTVLYEGTGATQYISNVGMDLETDGGLVWIKNRYSTQSHRLYDSVRGANLQISSNQTADEGNSGGLTSFDSNGFSLDNWASVNTNGNTYVSWVFKGGGDAVNIAVNSITASTPSIASDVSANTDAGFSIVRWQSTGSVGTVGHGLNSAPELIIAKKTDSTGNWNVYSSASGNDKRLFLNDNIAATTNDVWGNTTPTDSVFTQDVTSSTEFVIAYCFHSVSGYSSIGSYSGGSTSTKSTGFKPSFLLVKQINASGQDWHLFDSVRGGGDTFDEFLKPNTNEIESSASNREVNFTNDGFNFSETTSNAVNTSGNTYIYMAFK